MQTEDKTHEARLRLSRQWVVTNEADGVPATWQTVMLNDRYCLWHHPAARVWQMNVSGRGLVIIGLAVTAQQSVDEVRQWMLANSAVVDDQSLLCDVLRRLCGTYVLIHHTPETVSLYTDPAGMMPVFYRKGIAASTPALLGELVRDHELDRVFPYSEGNDWYPGTLTPWVGVHCLLANHRLDVARESAQRFWPADEFQPQSSEVGVARCGKLLRGHLEAISRSGRLVVSLTGGHDSRVNVAGLRHVLGAATFFTIRASQVKACDLEIPAKLATQFGLQHRFIDEPENPVPTWLTHAYDEISGGMAVGGRRRILNACRSFLGSDAIHVNGNLGAITKSFFWHNSDPDEVRLSALTSEFTHTPSVIEAAVAGWLDSTPDLPAAAIYNLMYLEQRGGRWMGIGESASNLFYESFTPFCSRELFEVICGMPTIVQHGGGLLVAFVQEMWPELLDVPYCRVTRPWARFLPRRFKNQIKGAMARVPRGT